MCDSVESCKNCIALRASNEQLKAELVSFQSLAQQCEDEAVDLRRQLCSALKDLAKHFLNLLCVLSFPKMICLMDQK